MSKNDESKRYRGCVKWFNASKGFGFIGRIDGEEDVFVHYSGIRTNDGGFKTLNDGVEVEFSVQASKNRPGKFEAVDVAEVALLKS